MDTGTGLTLHFWEESQDCVKRIPLRAIPLTQPSPLSSQQAVMGWTLLSAFAKGHKKKQRH